MDRIEIERVSEQWDNALIMYVVGHNNPTINAMTTYLKSQWSLSVDPTIYKHEVGYFIASLVAKRIQILSSMLVLTCFIENL